MSNATHEQALCRHIYQGDEKALEELIELHRHSLTAFINSFVHDVDTAEEIMIDVFVDLVDKKAVYRGESGLKTFLFAIGRNKALRYLRRKKQPPLTFLDEVEPYEIATACLEDTVETSLRGQTVRKALLRLRPLYREVLFLLYYEGMTNQQAAVVLHKSAKQVANLAYRAKLALRTILEEEGVTEYDQ